MRATIVLIADNEAENYGRSLMLEAHRAGGMGFEAARLPMHVSLKQTFAIGNLDGFVDFFDYFVKQLKPIRIRMEGPEVFPNDALGGIPSGVLMMKVEQSDELKNAQKLLFEQLEKRYGPCPAEHDDDYMFHMTVAIGGAPFQNYLKAYEVLSKKTYGEEFKFSRAGLFYYDDDMISPGTYFCYKTADLK